MSEPDRVPPALSLEEARSLAKANGLAPLTGRPPLGAYLRDLARRWSFIVTLSRGQSEARFQNNALGQFWALLNPLLLVASYFFIFGVLLRTNRGVDNFVAFLSIGVVLFTLSAAVIQSGSRSVVNNSGLVRALRFPRAVLPISVGLTELFATAPAFLVLLLVLLVTREPIRWEWLLFPVALILQMGMLFGLALLGARIVDASRDLANLIPVLLRISRYLSGVFFSVAVFTSSMPEWAQSVLQYQPFALQLELAREALMVENPLNPTAWALGVAWAIGLLIVGMVAFWSGEGKYGRG